MQRTTLKSIIKAINNDIKNGLIYVVIEDESHHYVCYNPIDIYDDGLEIAFFDDDNNSIMLYCDDIFSIKIL